MMMPGTGSMDIDLRLLAGALDLDLGDPGMRQPLFHNAPDLDVLVQQRRIVLLCVPARVPCFDDPEPKPDRMYFLTHSASRVYVYADRTSVIWLVLFLIMFPRPMARARSRFIATPWLT